MNSEKTVAALGLLLAVLLCPHPGRAQLPGASPATLATANNYTALARGFATVGLNPAGLGMPDREGITFAIFPTTVSQSLDPLSFGDFVDYEGALIPAGVKEDWLQKVVSAGGQSGGGLVEVTPASLSWSNFGIQVSTIASADLNLNDAAAELLLFGNAGRTGESADLDLQGSRMTGFAVTTVGISAGFPLARRWVPGVEQGLSVGLTLKQTWGHALVFAEDNGSMVQGDPVSVDLDFPMVHPSGDWADFNRGSGLGLDVGVAWQRGPWAASGVIQNLVNSFEWDLGELVYRPGQALFDEDNTSSDFEERPATEAPAEIRDKVKELKFKPVIGVAGAYDAQENLTVTAELRQRIGDGLETGPKSHLGLGMEYKPTPAIPLRAGLAFITDGLQLGGGVGLILGPVNLGLGALYQTGDVGDGVAATVGLSFMGG